MHFLLLVNERFTNKCELNKRLAQLTFQINTFAKITNFSVYFTKPWHADTPAQDILSFTLKCA